MLKEMIVMIAFLLALAGIAGSALILQKNSVRHMKEAKILIEMANEIN